MARTLVLALYSIGISYNLPKLSACATWNENGTTFADNSTVSYPFSVYITSDNSVFVTTRSGGGVQVWLNGSLNFPKAVAASASAPCDVFVTSNDDIYVDNGVSSGTCGQMGIECNDRYNRDACEQQLLWSLRGHSR